MRTLRLFLLLLLGCLFALPGHALDKQGAYSMEILVDGRPLREHPARDKTYVEALEGREYSVRLSNRTGRRVAVALAVDGLNSIDAKTTSARDASKWILGPHQTIVLDGWQTDSSTARRFFFTTEKDSYGAWLGRTSNLGIVSAAFFREKQRARPIVSKRREGRAEPVPSVPLREPAESDGAALSDDHAATGIGREVDHRVRRVRFEAEPHPAAVLDLRYEYRDALVRLGVLPQVEEPLARREGSRGFTDTGFAPDPYRDRP